MNFFCRLCPNQNYKMLWIKDIGKLDSHFWHRLRGFPSCIEQKSLILALFWQAFCLEIRLKEVVLNYFSLFCDSWGQKVDENATSSFSKASCNKKFSVSIFLSLVHYWVSIDINCFDSPAKVDLIWRNYRKFYRNVSKNFGL